MLPPGHSSRQQAMQMPLAKRRRLRAGFTGVKEYDASGLKPTLHGNLYQLKLLAFFLYQGAQQGYAFRLATEMDAAEKFDDLVFRYQEPGKVDYCYRFLQAKHKQVATKEIDWDALTATNEGEFDLKKYFRSFLCIRQRLANGELASGKVQDYILCTNIALNVEIMGYCEEVRDPDAFFNFKRAKAKRFRFKPQFAKRDALSEVLIHGSELELLAQLLIAACEKPDVKINLKNGLVKQYQHALTTVLVNSGGGKATFKSEFVNDDPSLPAGVRALRAAFKRRLCGRLTSQQLLVTELKVSAGVFNNIQGQADFPPEVLPHEVKAFLEKLVFAVGQPDQAALSEVLADELGKVCKLSDAYIWAALLEVKVLQWMQEKTGTFLTHEHIQIFLADLAAQIALQMLLGPAQWYSAQLRNCAIRFQHTLVLDDFWQGTQPWLVLHSTQAMHLVTLNLLQLVYMRTEYQAHDATLVLSASMLLDLSAHLEQALALDTLRLVIIDGADALNTTQIQALLAVCQRIKDNPDLKLILVCQQGEVLYQALEALADAPRFKQVEPQFADLSRATVTGFAGRRVLMSAGECTLGALTRGFDTTARQFFLKPELLPELTSQDALKVPKYLQAETLVAADCYISRTLSRSTQLNPEKLNKPSDDRFVIVGATVPELRAHFTSADEVVHGSDLSDLEESKRLASVRCVIVDTEACFDEVAAKFDKKAVHLVQVREGCFIWQATQHGIGCLRDYLMDEEITQPETETLPVGVTLISAVPGMGKSTLLEHMAMGYAPDRLLHMYLKRHQAVLMNATIHTLADVLDLFNTIAGLSTPFARQYLAYQLLHISDLVLQLDGFDEIDAKAQTTVIALVERLCAERPTLRVVLSTRPEHCRRLEAAFCRLAFNLVPLTRADQEKYLCGYWAAEHELDARQVGCAQQLTKYATALSVQFATAITDEEASFLGVPLQAKLLAQAYSADFMRYYQQEGEVHACLPAQLNVINLFQRFVQEKYRIYMCEKKSLPDVEIVIRSMHEVLNKSHQLLALEQFFPQDWATVRHHINVDILTAQELRGVGMVTQQDETIAFVHRTFAEYYLAMLMLEFLALPEPSPLQQHACRLYLTQLHKPRYYVIVQFIELMLKEPAVEGQTRAAWATLRANVVCPSDVKRKACVTVYAEDDEIIEDIPDVEAVVAQAQEPTLGELLTKLENINHNDTTEVYELLNAIAQSACHEPDVAQLQSVLDKLYDFFCAERFWYCNRAWALEAWDKVAKHCVRYLYTQRIRPSPSLLTTLARVGDLSKLSFGTNRSDKYRASANEIIDYWHKHSADMLAVLRQTQVLDIAYMQALDAKKIAVLLTLCKRFNAQEFRQVHAQRARFEENKAYDTLLQQVADGQIEAVVNYLLQELDFVTLDLLRQRFDLEFTRGQYSTMGHQLEQLYEGKRLTWLERDGKKWVLQYRILTPALARVFAETFHDDRINGWHTNYVGNIFSPLILELLSEVYERKALGVNTYAFLHLFTECLCFSVRSDVTHVLSSTELKQVMHIIARLSNAPLQQEERLIQVFDTLFSIAQAINGQLLIDGNTLKLIDVIHDDAYEISMRPNIIGVLRWRAANPSAKSEAIPRDFYEPTSVDRPNTVSRSMFALALELPKPTPKPSLWEISDKSYAFIP